MPHSVPALTRCTRVQISSPTELFNLLLGRKGGKKSVCLYNAQNGVYYGAEIIPDSQPKKWYRNF